MSPSQSHFVVFVALASFAAFALADKVPDFVIKGKCPNIDEHSLWQSQKPNHSKFGGVWFQHSLTNNPYQLLDMCVRLQYDFNGNGFNAKATGITPEGTLLKRTGDISPMPLGDPHLMVAFEDSFAAPLVILDTDYDNYACIYSCVDFSFEYHTDFSFIFTRDPSPSASYIKKCETAFKNIGVDNSRFQKTVQGSSCPYDAQITL